MSKHNRTISKVVHEFRTDMAARHSTFFLIYSDLKADQRTIAIKVTSNSTQEGASQIVGSMLEPTEGAVAFLAAALPKPLFRRSWAKREKKARDLLDKLRKMFVLSTLDPQPEEPDEGPKLVS
jgi:hypothetical protein